MVFDEIICASDDERFMLEALKEAARAAEEGEVPVGAVVVKDGQIIARAHNMVETARRSSAHAEMIALEYVTLEPCSMCSGAMVLARMSRLVIGADDPKTGACGSLYNIANDERLNHSIEITRGVLAGECSAILKEFFRSRRA